MPLELAHSPDLEVGVDGSSPPLTGDICFQFNHTSNGSSSAAATERPRAWVAPNCSSPKSTSPSPWVMVGAERLTRQRVRT